jgi:hypothetical protein
LCFLYYFHFFQFPLCHTSYFLFSFFSVTLTLCVSFHLVLFLIVLSVRILLHLLQYILASVRHPLSFPVFSLRVFCGLFAPLPIRISEMIMVIVADSLCDVLGLNSLHVVC